MVPNHAHESGELSKACMKDTNIHDWGKKMIQCHVQEVLVY